MPDTCFDPEVFQLRKASEEGKSLVSPEANIVPSLVWSLLLLVVIVVFVVAVVVVVIIAVGNVFV